MCAREFPKHVYELNLLLNTISPEKIIFEKPNYTTKTLASGYKVLEAIGVQKYVFQLRNIPYVDVSPTSVKKHITGSGTANKSAIKKAILERNVISEEVIIDQIKSNKDFKYTKDLQDHLWDAIAIGYYYLESQEVVV